MIEFSVSPLSWAGSNCARTKVTSMQTAVRRGRKRIKESYQNIGRVIFFNDGFIVRTDERSARTGYKWETVKS